MLQHDIPDDYIIPTNETHSVREFVERACSNLDISLGWEGEGVNEKGINQDTGNCIVDIDPQYFRPSEVDLLLGDYSKANHILNWAPKTTFQDLIKLMTDADLEYVKSGQLQ